MSRKVTIEELRERLEEIIAEVEAGESVTIVPDSEATDDFIAQRGKRFPFRDLRFEPLDPPITVDVVKLIREDREQDDPLAIEGSSGCGASTSSATSASH